MRVGYTLKRGGGMGNLSFNLVCIYPVLPRATGSLIVTNITNDPVRALSRCEVNSVFCCKYQ